MSKVPYLKAASLRNRSFFHMRYIDPYHNVAWHQREMFDFLDEVRKKTKRGVVLEPRDHLKSTTCSFSYPVQLIAEDETRNVRILIAQKTQKEASKTVSQIMRALKSDRMQQDFNLRFTRETGSFFMLQRSNPFLKDPTVEGVGVLGSITGGHFDYIFLDDIVDVKNARTEGERAAVKEWFYSTLSFVVEPDTVIFYIGTRKHYAELVADMLKSPVWMKLIRQSILVEPTNVTYPKNEDGTIDVKYEGNPVVLFPEKWTVEKLLMKKLEVGSSYFNREMQNNPQGDEDSPLKTKWWKFYRFEHEDASIVDPGHTMEIFPTVFKQRIGFVDPAISTDKKADNFSLMSIVIDSENRIFVEPDDQTTGHFDFPVQVKVIEAYLHGKTPWKFGVESNFYQRSLAQHLSRQTVRPIFPVIQTENKEVRIEATLGPMFEAGKIYIHHEAVEFMEEYETFPKGRRDDRLDALAGAIALALGSIVPTRGGSRMSLV